MKKFIFNQSFLIAICILTCYACSEDESKNQIPEAPALNYPSNAKTTVDLDITLLWQAIADPDGNELTYDVYLDTDVNPVNIVSQKQTETFYQASLSSNTTYYWKVIVDDGKGGTAESVVWYFSTKLKIGDLAHGGIVFFIDATGEHGLVCAESDQGADVEWGCNDTEIDGAYGSGVGSGAQNTIDIERGCSSINAAGQICASLLLNEYTDWFLPSSKELQLMHSELYVKGIGNFTAQPGDDYWSSTQYNETYAYLIWFSNSGIIAPSNKNNPCFIRAARAF